jgi:hypothetical protein
MVGRCPTCKGVIEVLRSSAVPPVANLSLMQREHRSDETGGFGAWKELWSVECSVCISKGMKVTHRDVVEQAPGGTRVYLTKKG